MLGLENKIKYHNILTSIFTFHIVGMTTDTALNINTMGFLINCN